MIPDYTQILTGILVPLIGVAVRYLWQISNSLLTIIREWEEIKKKILHYDAQFLKLTELTVFCNDNRTMIKDLQTWRSTMDAKHK